MVTTPVAQGMEGVIQNALHDQYKDIWDDHLRFQDAFGADFVPELEELTEFAYGELERSILKQIAHNATAVGWHHALGYDDAETFIDAVLIGMFSPMSLEGEWDSGAEYARVAETVKTYLNAEGVFHRVNDHLWHVPVKGVW